MKRPQPAKSKSLLEMARKEFQRLAPALFKFGLLQKGDLSTLKAYSHAYARWDKAKAEVTRLGTIIRTRKGKIIENPILAVEKKAMEQMKVLMMALGLSPLSRVRMKTNNKDPP